MREQDMDRFAAYHFMGAARWGLGVTDIVLASGDVYSGEKTIVTDSGKYTPIVVDFSSKDGRKRLGEIREEVERGSFDSWLELVFLPLYGKEKGEKRHEIVEEVIRFETELFRSERISPKLLAATLIMSNKLIDKDRLNRFWEDVKMLDIIELAQEKGMEKGMEKGREEGMENGKVLGMVESSRDLLVDAITEKFSIVPARIAKRVRALDDLDSLKALHRQIFRCNDVEEFEALLGRV